MSQSVSVHFKHRFPLFPLPETMLLPHAMMPLSIFEPRYIQLTDHALDSSGQIAIATIHKSAQKSKNTVPLRDAVCLAQIVQHEKASHGYNILVYGLCRAEIQEEFLATEAQLYRSAKLNPLEEEQDDVGEEYRNQLEQLLRRPNLQKLEYDSF